MLLSWFQPEFCLIIRAISCLLATLVLIPTIKFKETISKEFVEKQKQSTWTAWVQGWGYVLSNRIILSTMIFVTIAMAVLQLVDSQFPTLFKSLFPHDKSKMGYIISIIGLGGILGALLTQKLKQFQYGWVVWRYGFNGNWFWGIGLITPGTVFVLAYLISFIAGIEVG